MSTGVDNGKTPPSPFPTLHPRVQPLAGRPDRTVPPAPSQAGPPSGTQPRPSVQPLSAAPTAVPHGPVDGPGGQRPYRTADYEVAPPRPPQAPPVPAPPVPPLPASGRPAPAAPPRPAAPPVTPPAPPVPNVPPARSAPPPSPPRPAGPPRPAAVPLPPAAVPLPPAAPPRPRGPIPPAGPARNPYPAQDLPPRPAPAPAGRGRRGVVAAVCLVAGLGLVGGAVAGAVIGQGPRAAAPPADGSPEAFAKVRDVWRNTPVNQLFPPTVSAKNAGPGGADRTWTRVGVAAPAGCAGAFDPPLSQALAPVGCLKLLRASYVDSTSTTVTTVGVVVASGQAAAMSALNRRWTGRHLGERTDLVPRPVAFPGTPTAHFGAPQRGSWDVQISADLPFVVYAVSGFADGRAVPVPQPADKADADGATTAAAQAGLGFDATGLASAVDDRLHAAVTALLHPPTDGTEKR